MRLKRTLRIAAGTVGGAGLALAYVVLIFNYAPETSSFSSPFIALIVSTVVPVVVLIGAGIGYELLSYDDIAVVDIDHAIRREATGDPGADDIVGAIEEADEDDKTQGLHVRLDTPGGEVVASDDIRRAVEEFDGPTVASCREVCASGGYLIACACDSIYAREMSKVGSIGVVASRHTFADLADDLGVEYERLVGGRMKDSGAPTREMKDEEREYLQTQLVDSTYAWFVEKVSDARDISEADVLATEAKVFAGQEAWELGLVDHIGTEDDARQELEERIGIPSGESSVDEATPASPSLFGPTSVGYKAASGAVSAISDRFSTSINSDDFLKRR